ncbi:hypothetical protein F2P81_006368 [Scophthalmus maximus]|uniref:Uncharacterized protein n=3 Tax=Scophthalmus maximus TaxID=52904 RepID=A0A6A4T985_SCOMX|nr:hypothetical protein F2P81_006368 [Scophthalmus maximus]
MSLCPLKSQPNPLVCLRLLCLLLLLTDSSSSSIAPEDVTVPANPTATTQANYSIACNDGDVSENAANVSCKTIDVQTSPLKKSLPSLADPDDGQNFSVNGDQSSSSSSTHTSVSSKLNGPIRPLMPLNQSAGGNPSPKASPADQQSDYQLSLPENGTQHAAVLLSNTTGSSTLAGQTGSITSTGDAQPDRNDYTTTLLVTSTATTTPMPTTNTTTKRPTTTTTTTTPTSTTTTTTPTGTTSTTTTTTTTTTTKPTIISTTPGSTTTSMSTTTAAPHPATTIKAKSTLASAKTTVTTTTSPKMTPPSSVAMPQPNAPSTGTPPIHTQTAASATPPAKEPAGSGTRVAMVEVAGGALTRQLVDTASLLAILLFGLLFFVVAVAVFITQAYESYRRKDYTQVDYLINGMYTDSGV